MATRQINACMLLLWSGPLVPARVTPALPVIQWASRLTRSSNEQEQSNSYRAASVTLLCPLQDTERAGSLSAPFMSINCSAQEQFLVPVCPDHSRKHREIPSQVGWQPMLTEQGLAKYATESSWQSLGSQVALQRVKMFKEKPFS